MKRKRRRMPTCERCHGVGKVYRHVRRHKRSGTARVRSETCDLCRGRGVYLCDAVESRK